MVHNKQVSFLGKWGSGPLRTSGRVDITYLRVVFYKGIFHQLQPALDCFRIIKGQALSACLAYLAHTNC